MKVGYCTVVNRAFVPKAVALQRSVQRNSPQAIFAFYCIDEAAVALLRALRVNGWIISHNEFETPALRTVKDSVALSEYCWVCKSVALLDALERDSGIDWAVWLDADTYAFGDLDSALAAVPAADVALTPHRFTSDFVHFESTVGHFNAGYVAFRNSASGRAALAWWMERCLEGCPTKPVNGRYADQKYLDGLPQLFPNVAELPIGVNAAPWNIGGKEIQRNENGITVSSNPLLLYHFQGLRVMRHWAFDLYAAQRKLPAPVRRLIYRQYVVALRAQLRAAGRHTGDRDLGVDREFVGAGRFVRALKHLSWARNILVQP